MACGLSVYPSGAVVERDKVDKELGYMHYLATQRMECATGYLLRRTEDYS